MLLDGVLLDGGGERGQGFDELAFEPRPLGPLDGAKFCHGGGKEVSLARLYRRALTTSEAVSNYRSTTSAETAPAATV